MKERNQQPPSNTEPKGNSPATVEGDDCLLFQGDVFRQIFQQSPIATQLFKPDGTLCMVNKAWELLWQVSSAKAIGYNVFTDRQLDETGIPAFRRALAGETVLMEDTLYDPAVSGLPGRKRWLRTRLFPAQNQQGGIELIVVLHHDITEEKFAAKKYQTMIDNAQEAVLVLQDGLIKFANNKVDEFTEYKREEYLNQPFLSFVHPDDQQEMQRSHAARLQGQDVPPLIRVRVIDKDSSTVYLEGNASLIEWEGRPATLNLLNNVTERIEAEQSLQESEERFRLISEQSSDMIHLNDEEGTILFANQATEHLLGYRVKDIVNTHAFSLVHPDDQAEVKEMMKDLLASQKIDPREIRLIKEDGSLLLVEARGFAFTSSDGRKLLGAVLRDMSHRLEKERMVKQKLDSIGLLAGGIAHDFNNLLMAMTGNLSLMRTDFAELHPALAHILEMEKACDRAMSLTRQLLTFAKGGAPIKQTADICDIIRDSASFVLRGSNCACNFHFADSICMTEVDAGQISQVIQNLVINANHAMPEGGAIDIHVAARSLQAHEIPTLAAGEYIAISIQDQGIGIPEKYLPKIFDPYFSTKEKGSGLGLAAAYSIIRKHDGQMTVNSTPGKGSRFTIFLPSSSNICAQERHTEQLDITGGNGHILLMDDEKIIRKVGSSMLQRLGYEVSTAENGEEALELYQTALDTDSPFDAVILDLTVPAGMGGRETASRILEINPSAAIIASSGYTSDDVMANYSSYGFCNIIPKPYRLNDLDAALGSTLKSEATAPDTN